MTAILEIRSTPRDFLSCAALHRVDRVRYFVDERGLHPDCTHGGKPTALCYALIQPHRILMEFLVSRGANVNHSDSLGMTPLHYAALGGCEHCMAYIIHHGANRNARNVAGHTPLGLIQERSRLPERLHLADGRDFLERYGTAPTSRAASSTRFH